MFLGSLAAGAAAAVIPLAFTDAGWYDDTGFHDSANPSYLTGEVVIPPDPITGPGRDAFFHSFFIFTLPAISDAIVAAQLQIFNPDFGYFSGDPAETLGIFDVTTPAASLSPTTTGATGVFTDLGTGIAYGSQSVSAGDDGKYVLIDLDAAALAALNGAGPGLFAFGGALTTLNSPATEFVFAGTEAIRDAKLVLTTRPVGTVPEPSSLLLLGAGMLTALSLRRRKPR
jgi:hypothetical protein